MSLSIEGGGSSAADPARTRAEDLGHVLRMMRLLLTAVDHAGACGLTLTADSALVALLRRLVGEAAGGPHSSRTALMALRDLAFRVEASRVLLAERFGPEVAREAAALLDTADIRAFLEQEQPAPRRTDFARTVDKGGRA